MKRAVIGLVLIGVAPHLPFLAGGCLTDDFVHLGALADNADPRALIASPDTFGFYRPVQQLSYLIDAGISGFDCGVTFRIVNLALHAAAVVLAYALARRVLDSARGGFIAALMFALAPKAPTIAVFWISARSESLVTLFVLLAALAWWRWSKGDHWLWLMTAGLCYVLALLSKEAAVLLPLLLPLLPGAARPFKARAAGAAALLAGALIVVVLRIEADAMFGAVQQQYRPDLSPVRWLSNLWNYFARGLPAPAAILLLALAIGGWATVSAASRSAASAIAFGMAWYVAFVAAALPIALRSEIRVYLPAFGLALAAAAVIDRLMLDRRRARAALLIAIAGLGGYQAMRSLEARRDARFSEQFVDALAAHAARPEAARSVAIVPADREVEQRLRDTVGGYGRRVIARALGQPEESGQVYWLGQTPPAGALVLVCAVRDGAVRLDPALTGR